MGLPLPYLDMMQGIVFCARVDDAHRCTIVILAIKKGDLLLLDASVQWRP